MLPVLSATALVANMSLAIVALRAGLGIQGVAAGALLSRSLYAVALLWVLYRAAGGQSPVRYLGTTILSFGWCVVAVAALSFVFPLPDVKSAGVSVGLFLVLLLPLAALLKLVKHLYRGVPDRPIVDVTSRDAVDYE